MTATSHLIDMLRNDYRQRGRKSLFYRYKENDLLVKYNAYKAGGSKGRVTDHIRLCELYDGTSTGDPDRAAEYMKYVIKYLSSQGNISSGTVYLDGFQKYKNLNVLRDFKDRWDGYLSAFGFGKAFGDEHKTARDIAGVFGSLDLSQLQLPASWNKVAGLISTIHEQILGFCIDKAVQNDLENIRDSVSINKTLIDMCAEEGFLKPGMSDSGVPRHEDKIRECHEIMQEILAIADPRMKEEYDTVFIPLEIDQITGVSFCIVGKESYKEHYNYRQEENERYEKFELPCVPVVLHFTDVALGCMYSADQYEIQSPLDLSLKTVDRGYCEKVYSEYREAVWDARQLFKRINTCSETVGSLMRTGFYKGIFIDVQPSDKSREKKLQKEKEFDDRKKMN